MYSDYELKQKIMNSDEDAIKYMIQKYSGLISFIVGEVLSSLSIHQEDCVSDVFISAWKNIDQFDPDRGTLKNWIASIARFKSIDYLRRYSKEKYNVNIDDAVNISYDHHKEECDLTYWIDDITSGLDYECKDIVVMKFRDDYRPSEIARSIGKDEKYVYNRIFRFKQKLKRRLEDEKTRT